MYTSWIIHHRTAGSSLHWPFRLLSGGWHSGHQTPSMPGILPMKVIKVGAAAQSRIAQACDRYVASVAHACRDQSDMARQMSEQENTLRRHSTMLHAMLERRVRVQD